MIGTMPMALGTTSKEPPIGFHPEVPKVFSCLEEARNSFDYHWNGCVRIFNDWENLEKRKQELVRKYKNEQQEFLKIFQAWEKAFETFLQEKWATMDKVAQSGSRVLQMMQVTAYISLDSFDYDVEEELVWDKYLHFFKRNCDLAEAILATDKRKLPYFCLEMNFVAPLYAVAHKCRDPKIRRRAVALLYSSPRQEGIWHSQIAARVAQRLINIEEESLGEVTCAEDVPDWARLSRVEVKFDYQGRLGTVKYDRMNGPKKGMRRPPFTEVLNW